jgi:tetratricopeptide (TPR) repeat protein
MTTKALFAVLCVISSVSVTAAADDPVRDMGELESRLERDANDIQAANAYRRVVIERGDYDRALAFFDRLVRGNPRAENAFLNYGFAYVDKIPVAGSITQVILANSALTQFSKSIELRPSWIAYYTRGASYLFWPKVFGRAPVGIADLETALAMQKKGTKRGYHVRTFVALGDGYWKADDLARARATWKEGLRQFPGHAPLEARLSADPAALGRIIDAAFDPTRRVDTDLSELWGER